MQTKPTADLNNKGPIERNVFVEWAGLDATTAGGAFRIREPVTRTTLTVGLPGLITVKHDLVTVGDRVARALASTLEATCAEFLQTKINRLIRYKWQIGSQDDGFATCTGSAD